MKTFTIFTGTYNSEQVIYRVFKSIETQTCKDFEWIIIDDCSKDNTVSLLEEFRERHPELLITIYTHNTNTGVASSRKEALTCASGKYFVTWDHDDVQAPSQIETYLVLWQKHGRENIANIFAKMTDQHGKLLGRKFPADVFISDYISVHNKYLVGNMEAGNVVEHHVCVKTEKFLEVLKYYEKTPDLLNGWLPNGGDVWAMLAYLGYKTIYSNTPVRTYYINEPGRTSMSSKKRWEGADRIFRNKLLWVNYFDSLLSLKEYRWKLRNTLAVVMYGFLAGKNLPEIVQLIKNPVKRLLAIAAYPFAKVLAVRFSKQ